MNSLIKCWSCLLLAFAGGCCAKEYERSNMAGGWLKYHAQPASWEEARQTCHAEGAILASPLTEKLNSAIEKLVQNHKLADGVMSQDEITIFTGVHATSTGDYSSIEGVPLLKMEIYWAPEEPNNFNNSERCLAMTVDYSNTVSDTSCDRKLPYICYKKDTADKKYRFDYEWSEQAGGWLKYHFLPATWDAAKPRCQAEGAVLASPLTDVLEAAITSFVQNQWDFNEIGVTIFTGVQETSKGVYSSIEGITLQQSELSWESGIPDSYNQSQRCLSMTIGYNGTMHHTRCDTVLPYVCYKKNTKLTRTKCGTDPEYHMKQETGSCYKFHNKGLIWSEAFRTCIAEGGYLAVINNDEEAKVIKDIISKHPISSLDVYKYSNDVTSVGFHDWGHYGSSFMTIHGESLDVNYHKWLKGEPNNGTKTETPDRGEFCGTVKRNAELNDYKCFFKVAFLCEKMPNSLE